MMGRLLCWLALAVLLSMGFSQGSGVTVKLPMWAARGDSVCVNNVGARCVSTGPHHITWRVTVWVP